MNFIHHFLPMLLGLLYFTLISSSALVPPHGRVNTRCYVQWNAAKTNLEVVWRGDVYSQPWTFDREVDERTCESTSCVQRLFCLDSGVVGWLEPMPALGDTRLRLASLTGGNPVALSLRQLCGPSLEDVELRTPSHGHALAHGATLYVAGTVQSGHPDGYTDVGICAVNGTAHTAITLHDTVRWPSFMRQPGALYAAGPSHIALALVDRTALSAVYSHTGALRLEAVVMHEPREAAATLDVIALSGFSCRAFTDGRPAVCASIGEGIYTWDTHVEWKHPPPQPIMAEFELPATLFLLDFVSVIEETVCVGVLCEEHVETHVRRALAGAGMGAALAFAEDTLWAVERHADASCVSGSRLALVRRAVPYMEPLGMEMLGCEWQQRVPFSATTEARYAATAVKWVGPWVDDFALLTATDLAAHHYHVRGAADSEPGSVPTRAHLALGPATDYVQLHDATPRACPLASGVQPLPLRAAAGAMAAGDITCLEILLRRRAVRPGDMWNGRALAYSAPTAQAAMLFVAYGTPLEAKAHDGSTLLTAVVSAGSSGRALVEAGAAVCTWPRSVANVTGPKLHAVCAETLRFAHDAPCEPGFHLQHVPECDGLTVCPAGAYCGGYRESTNAARPCPAGTYGPLRGAVSIA